MKCPVNRYYGCLHQSCISLTFEFAEVNVRSDAIVRRLIKTSDEASEYTIGLEFNALPSQQRKALEVAILDCQHQQLRRDQRRWAREVH